MYKTKTLSNGLKIAYERIPHARSISAGVWVLSGSRYETCPGMSHFIEHMLFKGTTTKTAKEIAEKMDATGGQLNAYTTREYTSYYSITVAEHIEEALELLSDMIKNPLLSESDIETEKEVVISEIAMYEDSPEDLVFDLMEENAFSGNTLGRSITGSKESVASITKDDILSHMEKFYVPANMVLSVAGNFDEDNLLSLIDKYFGDMKSGDSVKIEAIKPAFFAGENIRKKDIEQANIALCYESFGYEDERRYPLIVLNNVLGGGMSSRLFQSIREKEGLAYSVYSSVTSYKDIGLFSVYAGLKPEHVEKTIDIIKSEIENVIKEGITDEELFRAKKQINGGIILGGETVSSHMSSLGKWILLNGEMKDEDYLVSKIEEVTKEDILSVAKEVFGENKFFLQIVE